ncbi:uncharacterized protein [Drosophila kikkawai]|uniref:Uncharacterized protein isoform X2 n=1 Tax=Drosophila kikkawai TaxID=30033 RepID=A0A6P4JB32_DROKI|nr:uncharacterized protein LOC108081993 isoform X2 [Drosophila kikkawai]
MPLPPNLPVPHIVGDDELEANAPIYQDHQLETDSSLSDSPYDDDDEVVEEGSSSSEGADWSMNVTRIAATPGRVPTFGASTPVMAEEPSILAGEANALPMPKMEVEVVKQSSLPSFLNLHPTSDQVTTNGVDVAAGNIEAEVSASTSPKDDSSPKPGSSRNLRNAGAAAPTQSRRILRSASATISGRITRMRTREINDNTPVKPLEITSYFRVLSASLVRNRMTVNSFQLLRGTIDRVLSEMEVP